MITKIIVGALLCCLVAVVGLFLYSDYQLSKDSVSGTAMENVASESIGSNSHSVEKNVVNTGDSDSVLNTTDVTEAQPDKSLPIPARQLKKLIADKPSSSELDKKIQAANEAIAALDKELPEQTKTAESNGVAIKSATETDEKSEEIKKRLQNIRDHIDKQP